MTGPAFVTAYFLFSEINAFFQEVDNKDDVAFMNVSRLIRLSLDALHIQSLPPLHPSLQRRGTQD